MQGFSIFIITKMWGGDYFLNFERICVYCVHCTSWEIFFLSEIIKIIVLDVYSGAPSLEDIKENNKNVRIHVQQLMHALGTFCKNNIHNLKLRKTTKLLGKELSLCHKLKFSLCLCVNL